MFYKLLKLNGLVFLAMTTVIEMASVADAQALPSPKYTIGIVPAEDRWVTLTDGTKVYQGVEISYLLGQELLNSGNYTPILLGAPGAVQLDTESTNDASTSGASSSGASYRNAQIPAAWTTWLANQSSSVSTSDQNTSNGLYQVKITPVVETLLYASGSRSDRLVFGFSPDHLDPFNEGRAGAEDNEFVASAAQLAVCQKPDFFNGQFTPYGWGPFNAAFGSNFDQGFSFSILGYGLTFKHMSFAIKDQIRFLVDNYITGTHQELVFQTKGTGSDLVVAGSYQGISLGFDIQRRTTLIQALQKLIPTVVDDFISQNFSSAWQTTITDVSSSAITIGAGLNENVNAGLELISADGNIYGVTEPGGTTSTVTLLEGNQVPVVGEVLQVYTGIVPNWTPSDLTAAPAGQSGASTGSHVLVQSTVTASGVEKVYAANTVITPDQATSAATQQAAVAACVGHNPGFFESLALSLGQVYGFYRYENVFDQKATPVAPAASGVLRVALIDSGVDVKDSKIKPVLSFSNGLLDGFDFISWDTRPSDDNGHGTAAAKLLLKLVKNPIVIMPIKVMGPQGETSSSAIYQGFAYAAQNHPDLVVAPWSSISSAEDAYSQGAQLVAGENIPVFVSGNSIPPQNNIYLGQIPSKGYKTSGLEATVVLAPEGVGAIQAAANWINSNP